MYIATQFSKLQKGMKLSKPIRTSVSYSVLLAEGTVINEKHLNYLYNKSLDTIYIKVEDGTLKKVLGDEIKVLDALPDCRTKEAYLDILCTMHNIFTIGREDKEIDFKPVDDVVKKLITEVTISEDMVMQLTSFRSYHEYTLTHSINVALLAVFLGHVLKLPMSLLRIIAYGGLLHDIGKLRVPAEILNKPGPLNEEELVVIRMHPIYGYEMMKEKAPKLDERFLDIILHHHEKTDGSGYPEGISGEDLSLPARIVAVADVYDALSSTRSYRQRMLPHESIEYLFVDACRKHLDEDMVKAFIHGVTIYPAGTKVELTNGQRGSVIGFQEFFPMRPTIRLEDTSEIINLLYMPNVLIKNIIHQS
ncbi:MAG: hypothetical protein APF76_08115 [Desulfitibacter sp. BRH_c19]|nr:MAG: hypothetical protein APF76_08115 [Desulfitibacter sp. BRH_c19]